MNKENEEKLISAIKKICRLEVDEQFILDALNDEKCDLIATLGFDSLLFVELIVEIEDSMNVEFDMNKLDIHKLKIYGNLRSEVENLLGDLAYGNILGK